MKREDLTEKLLDIKREKGWSWKHICEQDRRLFEVLDRRRHPRPDEADQAAGRQCRRAVRPVEVRNRDAQRSADARHRHADAADRSPDLPLLRDGDGQRAGLEGADRGRIRRRHHVGDRFRHGAWSASPIRRATASRSRCPANSCRTNITAPAATCRSTGSRRR